MQSLKVNPELTYRKLGAKLVVGMPFKDLATADSIIVRDVPDAADAEGRRTLRRLQEVGVHVLCPADALRQSPLPDAVALMTLREAVAAMRSGGVALPEGAARLAVTIDGTEAEEDLAMLSVSRVVVRLIALMAWRMRSSCYICLLPRVDDVGIVGIVQKCIFHAQRSGV